MDSEKTSVKEGEMEWKVKGVESPVKGGIAFTVIYRVNNDLCSHFMAGLA